MITGNTSWNLMPPVVKNLLIINGLMLLAAFSFESTFGINLWNILGLHYFGSELFEPYQFVTYMFMHGDLRHIFFNMFAVWMFGSAIENTWGSKRFLAFYLITGLGAALIHYGIIYIEISPVLNTMQNIIDQPSINNIVAFIQSSEGSEILGNLRSKEMYASATEFYTNTFRPLQLHPTDETLLHNSSAFFYELSNYYKNIPNIVGASGSLFGVLLAYGMMFPEERLFMMFIPIPIKARFFVIGYGLIELYSAFQNDPDDNVAHFAHLGGMIIGYLIIKFWQKTGVRWR